MKNNFSRTYTYIHKPEILFVIFALIFGIFFSLNTLAMSVFDEGEHFKRAVEVSKGIFISQNLESWVCGYSPIMYFASALGIKIGAVSEITQWYIFQTGRLFNLFIWIILIATAIKLTPVFKWLFFAAALLPASIFLGASYSADSFSNAFSFLFFAYLFRLIFSKQDLSNKDLLILLLLTTIGALCKGTIFPIFLLPLVKGNRHKNLYYLFILLVYAVCLLLYWKSISPGIIPDFVNQDFNKQYILEHPIKYILMIIDTVRVSMIQWISGCIGQMGYYTIGCNQILLSLPFYIGGVLFIPAEFEIKPVYRITALIILTIYTITTCTLLYFIYTAPNANYIAGVQARYYLQVIPLLFLIFGNNKLYKISKFYKNIFIVYIFIMLCYACYVIIQ